VSVTCVDHVDTCGCCVIYWAGLRGTCWLVTSTARGMLFMCGQSVHLPLSVVCIHQWYSNVHIHIRKRSHPRTNQTFTIVRTAIFCMIYMRIHAHATYCIECSYASFTRRARTDSRCGRSGTPRHLFYMYTHGGRCRNTYTHTCICMHLCTHNNTLADAYISNALTHILTHRLVEHKREHAR